MAFARDRYVASSSQTDFTITFPYLAEEDVTVEQEGAALTLDTDFTIVSGTTMRLATGAASGDIVIITRQTSRSTRIVDYTTASTLTEEDLDNDSLQAFYLVQEALDAAELALAVDQDNLWDAGGARIIEVAEPTDAQDAATKAYVEEVLIELGQAPTAGEAEDGDILVTSVEGAVVWAELSEAYIPDGLIDAGMLAANTITEAELANQSVTNAVIEDGAVDGEHFALGAVNSAAIEDLAIDSEHFALGAVNNAAIEDGAVDGEHFALGAVNNAAIEDGAIDGEHFTAGAVNNAAIEDGAINSEHFTAEAVNAAAIEAAGVTLAKIDASAGTEGFFLKNEETTSVVWAASSGGGSWTQLAGVATTSGTSVTIAAATIPATAKEIRILIDAVSTNTANTAPILLFTDSGGTDIATGYLVSARLAGTGAQTPTTHISLAESDTQATSDAADSLFATITMTRVSPSSEKWMVTGWYRSSQITNASVALYGSCDFSATPLRGLRITTAAGTATFDAGTVNLAYFD